MIQFYFLSIFCNAAAGYILFSSNSKENQNAMDNTIGAMLSMNKDTLCLILGILSIITGFFKLLSAVQGDIPVIGDLFPALLGVAVGFILVFEYYRKRATIKSNTYGILAVFIDHNKKWIGFLAIMSAILHFLFPQALLI
jgi:uncharacterized membrane-anchored protein